MTKTIWPTIILALASLPWASFADQQAFTQTTTTSEKPKRIIALAPHVVEMLYNIGAGEQIVGTVEYADYPEQALSIPRVGGYHGIQIEKILALNPDLIIIWKSGAQAADIQKIQSLGLNVAFSEPGKIADVATELRYFGKLTHNQEQAEKSALAFEQRLASLIAVNQNKMPLKVFYQLWSQPMMTINKDTWINQLIDVCQGDNVFADNPTNYPKIGIENVIIAAPELMIIPDEKADKPQPKIAWHNWPEIPAIKKNQSISVNADLLHRYSSRMLDGIEDMCEKMDKYR